MWLVRSILIFAAIVAVLVFAIGNVENRTTIRLITTTYENVHLNLVLLCAALFGAGACFFAMIFREIGLRTANRRLRRDAMRLDDELTALRNLPLSGIERQSNSTPPPTSTSVEP